MTRNGTLRALVTLVLALLAPLPASAACSSPPGSAGDVIYSSTNSQMYYCNSASWISMGGSAVAYGTLTTGDLCTATSGTQIACTTAAMGAGNGGTGLTSITTNGILYGQGTSAAIATAAGSQYNVFVAGASGVPAFGQVNLAQSAAVTGTLPVGNGGSGTATAFTAGSVIFAGASGVYSQDNASFFWDDTNNRLGIGTTSPAQKLHVVGESVFGYSSGSHSGVYVTDEAAYGTAPAIQGVTSAFATSNLALNPAGGNVGIGTTNPQNVLSVSGAIEAPSTLIFNEHYNSGWIYDSTAAAGHIQLFSTGMQFYVAPSGTAGSSATEVTPLFLANSGNVGIGTATVGAPLHVYTSTGAAIVVKFQNGTGYCTMTPITITWTCTSDRRLKKDIVDTVTPALPWLSDMRIRDFTMKADGSRHTGVIAQEMLPTHPDMVHLGKDDGIYSVDAPNPWRLVKAIQEVKADNDNLHSAHEADAAAIAELRTEITALKAQVAAGHR